MKYLLCSLLLLAGCDVPQPSQATSVHRTARVTCYSGGEVIYEGQSSKNQAVSNTSAGGSQVWTFVERESGKWVSISGTCVVRYS